MLIFITKTPNRR